MTSDLTDELGSLEVNDNRVSISSNLTSRRSQTSRPRLRPNRAATIDHGSHEEKLRIVVLGATKVGAYFPILSFVTHHSQSTILTISSIF